MFQSEVELSYALVQSVSFLPVHPQRRSGRDLWHSGWFWRSSWSPRWWHWALRGPETPARSPEPEWELLWWDASLVPGLLARTYRPQITNGTANCQLCKTIEGKTVGNDKTSKTQTCYQINSPSLNCFLAQDVGEFSQPFKEHLILNPKSGDKWVSLKCSNVEVLNNWKYNYLKLLSEWNCLGK